MQYIKTCFHLHVQLDGSPVVSSVRLGLKLKFDRQECLDIVQIFIMVVVILFVLFICLVAF